MASVIKRLRRKYKGVKWIDSPFAGWYRRRLAAHRLMLGAMVSASYSAGLVRIRDIHRSKGSPVEKKIAIAQATIATHQAACSTAKHVNAMFGMQGAGQSNEH